MAWRERSGGEDREVCPSCNGERAWSDFHEPDGATYRTCYSHCRRPGRRETYANGGRRGIQKPDIPQRATGADTQRVDFDACFAAVRKDPVPVAELAASLGVDAPALRAAVEQWRTEGRAIRIVGQFVAAGLDDPDERVRRVGIAAEVGRPFRCAVISDTHLGSKYCLRDQLREFIEHAYASGVRNVLHPGDVLDGCYRHSEFEVSHVGLDEQARDLFETLPHLPGLTYHAITGNHDHTFTEKGGVEVGGYLTRYFRDRGRDDLRFYGNRSAFLRIGGAVVHLWHPLGGGSYARSYKIQKRVEQYASGEKPHILLVGHWHMYCAIYERGVHGLACPTFQGGGSQFGKALGGSPAIGGMILEWTMTGDGTMRSFRHEYRAYFERERPQQIEDDQGWREEVA